MKVLFIEDSTVDHYVASHILEKNFDPIEIIWVCNGQEALDKLRERQDFDLILLDINMPLMNGLEFLEKYDKNFTKHIDTYPLSSSNNKKDVSTALSYNFVLQFLQKPIGPIALDIMSAYT